MAFNDNTVTTLKGKLDGPIYTFPTAITRADITATFDPEEEGGILLGEISTDGIENNESADTNEARVWSGRKLRSIFNNWTDQLVTNLVSKLDVDVAKALYGDSNVTTASGMVTVAHGLRQPPVRSILVCAVADDGTRHWLLAEKAQPDINISQSWNETDLVTLPVTWNLFADAAGKTHYEFTFSAAA